MQPTTLIFNDQYLPIENSLKTFSLIPLDSILTQLNQKQITPTFNQNLIPNEKDCFSSDEWKNCR